MVGNTHHASCSSPTESGAWGRGRVKAQQAELSQGVLTPDQTGEPLATALGLGPGSECEWLGISHWGKSLVSGLFLPPSGGAHTGCKAS